MSNAFLYGLTVLIWGSTWYAIEFQLGVVAPAVSVVYRYGAASILLFGWCACRGLELRFPMRDHVRFLALGVLLFGFNYIIAYQAQIYISSALTAIAFSTLVWMNIINARLLFGTRVTRGVLLGALLGAVGVVVLFTPQIGEVSLDDEVLFGAALAVLSALVASFGNMVSQASQRARLPVMQSNAWGMFYGALTTALVAALDGQAFNFDWSPGYVGSLVYLTVFGSIVAFGAYLTLLGRIGADRAGYAMVLFPVVALVISVVLEGLEISAGLVVGCTLVIAGNILVMRARRAPGGPSQAGPSSFPLGRRLARALKP
ncbi:MAG: EamA family transporter [Xanthomonadales bacterium]|nr:EamA family transporter [Xanthomonadales bacterium]